MTPASRGAQMARTFVDRRAAQRMARAPCCPGSAADLLPVNENRWCSNLLVNDGGTTCRREVRCAGAQKGATIMKTMTTEKST